MTRGSFKTFSMAALFSLGLMLPAIAAEVSVTAELNPPEIAAGDRTMLQIKVSGSQQADPPQQIQADGLQISLTGQSTQFQMVNFKVSSSVVYSYSVMPQHAGNFTIPSVTVGADGRQFSTPPLSLKVVDDRGGGNPVLQAPQIPQQMQPPLMPGFTQRPPRPVSQHPDAERIAFGEISSPKKTLYVGEMTPVEIRYYFDARYSVQIRGGVDFGSEGILVERFPNPKEGREERDGITYNVLTFRSLLSAVKPGVLDIAAAKLNSQIQMPGETPPGFDDPVFQQLLGGRGGASQTRDVTVSTAPLHLDVLPLPKEGRPDSFAGAVGEFDIDAAITNRRPAPGDPVDLVVKISGKGNFKGMGAPVLTNTDGWRSYPPSDKFENSDELSYSGVKSFDFTLIAQQPQRVSPGAEFSYFDPVAAKYVTLTAKPMALEASPGSAPQASVPATNAPPASQSATPTPAPAAAPDNGNPQPSFTLHSWKTPVQRPEFLVVSVSMLVAVVALGGILFLRDLNARGGTAAMRRKRHLAQLWSLLNSETVEAAAAYDAAVEYAGLIASPSDALDAVLSRIIERRDLLKYGTGGSIPLTATERGNLLGALRSLSLK